MRCEPSRCQTASAGQTGRSPPAAPCDPHAFQDVDGSPCSDAPRSAAEAGGCDLDCTWSTASCRCHALKAPAEALGSGSELPSAISVRFSGAVSVRFSRQVHMACSNNERTLIISRCSVTCLTVKGVPEHSVNKWKPVNALTQFCFTQFPALITGFPELLPRKPEMHSIKKTHALNEDG